MSSQKKPSLQDDLLLSKLIKELKISFSVKFPSQDSHCSVVNEGTATSFKKPYNESSLAFYFSL